MSPQEGAGLVWQRFHSCSSFLIAQTDGATTHPALPIMPWAKTYFFVGSLRWTGYMKPVSFAGRHKLFSRHVLKLPKRSGQHQQTSFPNNIQLLGLNLTRAYLSADLSVQCRSPKVPPKFLTAEVGLLLSVMFFWSACKVGVTSENYETIPPPISLIWSLRFQCFSLLSFTYKAKNILQNTALSIARKEKKRKKAPRKWLDLIFSKFWYTYRALRRHATGVN